MDLNGGQTGNMLRTIVCVWARRREPGVSDEESEVRRRRSRSNVRERVAILRLRDLASRAPAACGPPFVGATWSSPGDHVTSPTCPLWRPCLAPLTPASKLLPITVEVAAYSAVSRCCFPVRSSVSQRRTTGAFTAMILLVPVRTGTSTVLGRYWY
jgi:hypothetical protein